MYEIRQARIDDWPLIQRFIDRCYGAEAPYKQEKRWRWQFVDNPYRAASGSSTSVWIALHEAKIAGQIAVQPGRMWIDGQAIPAGWIVDVMVDPDHRGAGLGHRIHDAIVATGQTVATLTMAPATRRIAERAGCITLGAVLQMVRVRRLSPRTIVALVTPRIERRSWARKPGRLFNRSQIGPATIATGLSTALRLHATLKGTTEPKGTVITVDGFEPAAIERLFEIERTKIPALFDRGTDFFRWRYEEVPDLRYQRARLNVDGATAGFVVWRMPEAPELPIGTLTDIVADPADPETIVTLAKHAVTAMEERTEAIVAGASHPTHVAALKRLGFVTSRIHRPTIVTTDTRIAKAVERVKDQWHFTKADHDWDQIHPVQY